MNDLVLQAFIVAFSGAAVYLVGRTDDWKKWGYYGEEVPE